MTTWLLLPDDMTEQELADTLTETSACGIFFYAEQPPAGYTGDAQSPQAATDTNPNRKGV